MVRRRKPIYGFDNRMIQFTVLHVTILATTYLLFGAMAVFFHLIYSAHAIYLGESVSYIEHYGLRRKKQANGHYESVGLTHSWNAAHRISNWLLFRIQRHSDHHVNSYRPYQILRSFEISPQLPFGYGICITMAGCPPVWFSVINPYVEAIEKNQVISPTAAKKSQMIGITYLLAFSLTLTALTIVSFIY